MSRRSFFARLIGFAAAAVAIPFVKAKPNATICAGHSTGDQTLTFLGGKNLTITTSGTTSYGDIVVSDGKTRICWAPAFESRSVTLPTTRGR